MGNLLLVFAQWTPQHGAQWLPQHAPMGATSHAICKALPLPCAHHVAMTPAQPSSHWIGFCWGCCANHAHFLCFCDCANILGCGNNCGILVWFGQRTGKTTGCTFPRCVKTHLGCRVHLVHPRGAPASLMLGDICKKSCIYGCYKTNKSYWEVG